MMKKMNSILTPRIKAKGTEPRGAGYEIGGMRALELGQEYSRAQRWFDSLSDSDRQDWLNIARSENLLDAWKAFQRKCE
jgi:hypothetical protein